MKATTQLLSIFMAVALLFTSCENYESKSITDEAQLNVHRNKQKTQKAKAKPVAPPATYQVETERKDMNTEEYATLVENDFLAAKEAPLSTFSIDVDNASYSNMRRFLNGNSMPYQGSVRIEEMVNYFTYDYPNPTGKHPFSITTELSDAPWNPEHKLVHIGLQGKKVDYDSDKASNLVFLIDCSGSMADRSKLALVKKSLTILMKELDDRSKISIVTYAGAAGLVLDATKATDFNAILDAIGRLQAGGSTAGGEGIQLAYNVAKRNYIEDGNNRVILCTDGDFNVGVSSTSELVSMVEQKRSEGVFLTICGYGMGNYKDDRMEQISNHGNGNYFYIDNVKEAEKVFKRELKANLFTIAKDVKLQVEFNPAKVKGYRLIGYENRRLNDQDFADDTKDAGELGAGHTVTALYEIIPADSKEKVGSQTKLKYQESNIKSEALTSEDWLTVKFRYKPIKSETSILLEDVIAGNGKNLDNTSENFRYSAAVAGFGMLLIDSKHKGNASYESVKDLAQSAIGKDEFGYRAEMIELIDKAKAIQSGTSTNSQEVITD